MSSREFYLLLKNMIEEYRYPDVICTPVTLKEGGIFSSKRDYMRISRQRYHFFVCASPFGRSFFISWWLQEDANKVANAAAKVGMLGRVIAQRMESKTYYELKWLSRKLKPIEDTVVILFLVHNDGFLSGSINEPIL